MMMAMTTATMIVNPHKKSNLFWSHISSIFWMRKTLRSGSTYWIFINIKYKNSCDWLRDSAGWSTFFIQFIISMELQSHNSTKSSFICFKNPFLNHKVIKLLKNKLKPLCLKNIKNKNSSQTTATIAPPSYSLSPSFMSSRAKLTNNDLGLNYHILQEKVRRHIHENRLTEQRHSRKQSEDNDESGPL